MERIFKIRPAFDKRSNDPKKDYGIHGCEMIFVLKGDKGAVQFVLYTNWHLPHVQKEQDKRILDRAYGKVTGRPKIPENLEEFLPALPDRLDQVDLDVTYHPMPADLGVHSPVPLFEGHKPIGSEWVDMEAMKENLEKLQAATKLGIESEEMVEMALPTGVYDPCEFLDGKPCYYDGSGLDAEPVFERMLREGSDGVWDALEKYYKKTFETVKEGK